MQITEEDIEKAVLERGLKLLGVEGRGSRARIRVACPSCGGEKTLLYTSLWHQSTHCRNCHRVPLDLDTFRAYLSNGQWEFRGPEPELAREILDLQCKICGKKRRLRYRSFMNKPYCRHRQSYVQMLIESDFNQMGYQVHRMPTTRRTQVQVTCRNCGTPRKISLQAAQKVGGCPECELRRRWILKIPIAKKIIAREGSVVRLLCWKGHEFRMHRDKAARWISRCPTCRKLELSHHPLPS